MYDICKQLAKPLLAWLFMAIHGFKKCFGIALDSKLWWLISYRFIFIFIHTLHLYYIKYIHYTFYSKETQLMLV